MEVKKGDKKIYSVVYHRSSTKNDDLKNNINKLSKLNINNSILNNNTERQKNDNVNKTDQNQHQINSKVQSYRRIQSNKLTKFIAIDCEMVGVGIHGDYSMLARVSIVNKFGDCIYDKFVKPVYTVVNYRTEVSGIRAEDLLEGENSETVQKEVAEILRGRVLVGHSLMKDLAVLGLSHPLCNMRDTSKYIPFIKITKGKTPSLKRLAKEILGIDIQNGEHSSIEDAKAVMQVYCAVSKNWEQSLSRKHYNKHYREKNVQI